ncbi:O-methyltransferase [Neptunitalea lumnitzerae]|uniref:O-methyltransferase n=1 Tax=Neptunitalea lumnitzerae TaxID=2965509 RepID=A0ABQ5MN88_9FLAO|nr:class I SAM-dependent methyltransferase [Neptunitalea sp. Y10]GLB50829.1 O-methyltransferase [Neptunitalea sp. Y10]
MNTHLIRAYFKFIAKSTNQHGVHSPFVYDFVTKCCYNKAKQPEYKQIKNYRKTLFKNTTTITVEDFGAGSKVFKSNQRAIHKIAKTAGITYRRAKLLYRITNYFSPETILEIGTSLGMATFPMALGSKKAKITSIEGCNNTAKTAAASLQKFNIKNTKIEIAEFTSFLNQLPKINQKPFDLIYFDGNHTKIDTLNYFELLLPYKHNNSVWIFDDIHWSKEMTEAWEIIKEHPEVQVTIDSFYWGIVFFRKEQAKQNFTIRL